MSASFELLNNSQYSNEALVSQLNVMRAANILQEETVGTVTEQLEEKTQVVNQLKNTIENLQQIVAQHERQIESQQKQIETLQKQVDSNQKPGDSQNTRGRPISMITSKISTTFLTDPKKPNAPSSPNSNQVSSPPFESPPIQRNNSKTNLNSSSSSNSNANQINPGLAAAAAKMAQDTVLKRRESLVAMKLPGDDVMNNLKSSGDGNQSPVLSESPTSSSPMDAASPTLTRGDSSKALEPVDILFTTTPEGVKEVRGGTIHRLVERLTWHAGIVDSDYLKAFFLTYRSFSTSDQILDLILQRYECLPENVPPEKIEATRQIIRLRVVNVLRAWLTQYYNDFEENPQLKNRTEKFVDETISKFQSDLVSSLKRCLSGAERESTIVNPTKPPMPVVPKTNNFIDFDAAEFARQMCIADFDLLIKIKQIELLGKPRTNLDLMIRRFNTISNWVATSIVNEINIKERVRLMRHFIKVAKECRNVGNFNGTMQIVSGLQSSAVHRLHKTWEKLSKTSSQEDFDFLLTLTSTNDNYNLYRKALKDQEPPSIPFLGVCLTDLTFIEDGMKNDISPGIINFAKRKKVSIVVEIIRRSQSVPYPYHAEKTIQHCLSTLEPLNASLLWQQSLICEPRAPQK
eukprot:TRINITY_DN4017_c0_g2_i2.p1 TRINITY_DN4017_c0_g2~~TRINITY_DN4017_c0_g2_i2.p1  ORF type:complete len:632 (+),score=215.08 TRINITY_DN4017_c0_g2_i2:203-2098(+)